MNVPFVEPQSRTSTSHPWKRTSRWLRDETRLCKYGCAASAQIADFALGKMPSYICLARRPGCPECVIRTWCEYPDKTPAEAVPGSARTTH